jgi:hypothetical protein
VVNEYEIRSTVSSEDKSEDIDETEEKYAVLEKILSTQMTGVVSHRKQRILVESVFSGLLGE